MRAVRKCYGRRDVLSDFTLDVARGRIVGLAGPNGSGKSTILALLAGWTRPSAGTVTLLGYSPMSPELIGKVGALPEGTPFPPAARVGTYLSYLARLQGAPAPTEMADAALRAFGEPAWKTMPFRDLSYGMRRRVGLAQAFMGEPSVVLLDEPTEGLDGPSVREVGQWINRLRGTTFVVSSHDSESLNEWCDEIVVVGNSGLR
jgi:ABC-2 type transport system ATP-binding protein